MKEEHLHILLDNNMWLCYHATPQVTREPIVNGQHNGTHLVE